MCIRDRSIDSPENMVAQTKRFLDEGFTHIKVKLGKNADDDILRIATLRNALGPDIPLRIDANQGWTPEEAIHCLLYTSISKPVVMPNMKKPNQNHLIVP